MPKQAALIVQDPLIVLARSAVERYIRDHTLLPVADPLPDDQRQSRGLFVCLLKAGDLRGCVGHVRPRQSSLAKEVIYTAVAAAINDPRFSPVQPEELSELSYIVDLVDELKTITNTDMLDPATYGVVVYHERRIGVVLPNTAEIDDANTQLELARQRAGATSADMIRMERFRVRRLIEISGDYQQTISSK